MTKWIYGKHSCLLFLENKNSTIKRVLITENFVNRNKRILQNILSEDDFSNLILKNIIQENKISNQLPENSVHQGIAILIEEKKLIITDILEKINNKSQSTIVITDKITDPHNLGAITRSAAAFNIDAIFMPLHGNTQPISPTVSKSACGGTEFVDLIQISNINNLIEKLKKNSFWIYGLSNSPNSQSLYDINFTSKSAIILGSEDKGIRPSILKSCDYHVKIIISDNMESLNVSNAAAITMSYIYNNS